MWNKLSPSGLFMQPWVLVTLGFGLINRVVGHLMPPPGNLMQSWLISSPWGEGDQADLRHLIPTRHFMQPWILGNPDIWGEQETCGTLIFFPFLIPTTKDLTASHEKNN